MDTKLRGPLLWLVVFVGGAGFQYWRHSQVDTIVYSVVAVMVLLSTQGKFRNPEFDPIRFRSLSSILILCALIFLVAPIHSWVTSIFYLLTVLLIINAIWRRDSQLSGARELALRRASIFWSWIGALTCFCELGNYFASDITHNDKAFPTITVLVDPIVADRIGKVFFVLLWTVVGVGLFKVSAQE